jgi:hypothetical protein
MACAKRGACGASFAITASRSVLAAKRVRLAPNRGQGLFGIEIHNVHQELIRLADLDPVRSGRLGREVAHIPRHQLIDARADGGREHVTVFLVVGHRRDEELESLDNRFGERLTHMRKPAFDLLRGLTKFR